MARSVDSNDSRYVQGGLTYMFPTRMGWWERRTLEKDESDKEIILTEKYNNRPDLLSYDLYGTPHLQTLILQFNGILDMLEEFVTGAEIVVPTGQRMSIDIINQPTGGIDATLEE